MAQTYDEWELNLDPRFLICRDLGHTWGPFKAHWDAEHNAFSRTLRCTRCKRTKTEYITASGYKAPGSRSTYPDGYLAPRGSGPYTMERRAGLRLRSIMNNIQE